MKGNVTEFYTNRVVKYVHIILAGFFILKGKCRMFMTKKSFSYLMSVGLVIQYEIVYLQFNNVYFNNKWCINTIDYYALDSIESCSLETD